MATYIILSRISPDALADPPAFKEIAKAVSERIKAECPGVTWKESYATLGRFDFVDLVESEDPEQVTRAALIIRSIGHSATETLPATPWKRFLDSL